MNERLSLCALVALLPIDFHFCEPGSPVIFYLMFIVNNVTKYYYANGKFGSGNDVTASEMFSANIYILMRCVSNRNYTSIIDLVAVLPIGLFTYEVCPT